MADDYDGRKDGASSYEEGIKAIRYRLINEGRIKATEAERDQAREYWKALQKPEAEKTDLVETPRRRRGVRM